jgi:D-inositol-3-phosphate glycosyltransferase
MIMVGFESRPANLDQEDVEAWSLDKSKMVIKVAMIEPVGGHGGMNFYDFALCRSVVKAGGQARLFTCEKTVFDGSQGFPIHIAYRGVYGKSPAWLRGLRFCFGSLKALVGSRASGHQVAHFHFFHVGPLELFNVLLARLLGFRVVITAHDVEAFKKGLSIGPFVRLAYRLATRIIAHSQIAKRELMADLKIPEKKINVILHGNFIDTLPRDLTREAAKAHFGLMPEQRVLVFFGQIKDVKGLDVLLNAFALARESDKSLHLLIGGRVWKTDFSKYSDIIEKYNLTPHCTLHIRYIPDAEVKFFYRSADLVVLPYRRIYQSGVILEAMSYSSAVLVSNIDGMLEVIDDERTGFVFKNQDPQHLAQRIGEIFLTPGHSDKIAQEGFNAVKIRNNWSRLGEQTIACYQKAIQRAQE